jgi:polysaccharide biosynthesis protein PelA
MKTSSASTLVGRLGPPSAVFVCPTAPTNHQRHSQSPSAQCGGLGQTRPTLCKDIRPAHSAFVVSNTSGPKPVGRLGPPSAVAAGREASFTTPCWWLLVLLLSLTTFLQAEEPSQTVPRRILVLFGRDPRVNEGARIYPIDSLTASTLQAALEWQGYELDYFDIGHGQAPATTPDTAGIIMDGALQLHADRELALAEWMDTQRRKGIPFLLIGDVPVFSETAVKRWQKDFGIDGDLQPIRHLKSVEITKLEPTIFGKEIKIEPRLKDFQTLTAPPGSEVYISLTGKDEVGGTYRYDPVFRAPWGVAWLGPYVTFDAAGSQRFYYVEPFKLITKWLGARTFPAPDVTTRLGRRLFFSHIDGDGFAMRAHRPGQPTCAELIRDRVLKRYPFPVTVSVVESDIRGQAWSLKPEDAPQYEALAKEILAMPHVEAASHSYSHPFYWDENDANPGVYATRFAPLHPSANYKELNLKREIVDSVSFINEHLLPPNKKVQLMLWSGNCRPGLEALQITRQLGIENMNGGDTVISEMYPSLINIAPRVMQWGDELQVHAANQNEFMYSDGFAGPFFGGFSKVVQTFERTETPTRFKPVNVYYHFYSAMTVSAERALKKILDWCWTQPLHHITASDYVRAVKDTRIARIEAAGEDRWKLLAGPHLLTWRLPATAGTPDLASSRGVIGYKYHRDQIYLHTDGRPEVLLVMTNVPLAPHLYIAECSGQLHVNKHERTFLSVTNKAILPVKVILGGLPPDAKCQVDLSSPKESNQLQLTADKAGAITFLMLESTTADVTVP